jgi:transcriptional regulator with XRE-family HTH domain
MEDKRSQKGPYRPLGRQLKALRDKANETLAEVSGAVEIDVRQLASFELGQVRPTEEVLLLLISHLGAHDEEAVKLWELAGYGVSKIAAAQMSSDIGSPNQQNSGDHESKPILFTDVVDIMVNNYGVVMNFMQSSGPNSKPGAVARVGMSREHAKSVLQILQVTLAQTEQIVPKIPNANRRIIAPENSKSDDQSRN